MTIKVLWIKCDYCGKAIDGTKETYLDVGDGQHMCNECNDRR